MNSGAYFRIKRNNKWENILLEELEIEEINDVLKDKDVGFLKSVIDRLAHCLGQSLIEIEDLESQIPDPY